MQKSKKFLLCIIPVCVIVLGMAACTLIFFLTRDKSVKTENTLEKYSVSVKDEKGNCVENVYVVLCSENGTQISWLPYATNELGNTQVTDDFEQNCYVKVIGAPLGYEIDESTKYTFDKNGKVTIVLKESNIAYAAKIGETYYTSLQTALGVANASSDDTVVEVLADSSVKPFTFSNIYASSITVNGNGFVLTAEGANNTFSISQEKGAVTFENMTLKHKNTGSAFQITGHATVNITNVNLDATEGTAYNYALINTLLQEGTGNLNLTNVDAKMAVGTPAKANEAGIIRTGNSDVDKTINITLSGCNFDTTGATGRSGIVIMKKTTANIKINDSAINAGDAYAIWNTELTIPNTLTIKNSKIASKVAPYSASPLCGYEVRIGDVYYPTITHAVKAAEKATDDITLTIINNFTINTCEINGKNGNLITIDGNGKTLTSDKGNNVFVVGNRVAFKNMYINHKNTGSVIHIKEKGCINVTDVDINATEGKEYTYTLFNLLAPDTITLNLTRVNVKMSAESKGRDSFASVIRTGNTSEADANTVVINLNDCNLDTTEATGRCGIAVVPNTKATVNLKNTKITTKDTFAILSNEEEINWNNSDTVLTSLDNEYKSYPVKGYLAKIGDVFYTLKSAIKLANNAVTDTTINLLADYSLSEQNISNKNGNGITLNGNDKTITTSGGNNAFIIGKNVVFENMNVVHKDTGSVFQIAEAGIFNLSHINIKATEGKEYRYALINTLATGETTLNLNNVSATMAVAMPGVSGSSAIIRTGNDGDAKTVNLNLNNCNFDTTAATGRNGIVVMQKTIANIRMYDTKIFTLNEAPLRANEDSALAYTLIADNCAFTSKTTEYQDEPIRGYDAKIGNIVYHDFKDALAKANAGDTIELLQDFAIGETNIEKSLIIDGNNYTLTAAENLSGTNTFRINKSADVTFKNLKITDKRSGSLVQIRAVSNVSLENVDVDATKSAKGYDYCLINVLATGTDTSDLTLKGVHIEMSTEIEGKDKYSAIIRTGNAGNGETKKVNISLTDCVLDATDAGSRYGIAIMDTTDATVSLTRTKIKTQNVSAVKCFSTQSGQLTVDTTKNLICGKKANEIDGYTFNSGNIYSVMKNEDVFSNAVNSESDVTVTLQSDTTVDLDTLVNVNGKTITIDTNGFNLTTTGTMGKTVGVKNTEVRFTTDDESVYSTFKSALAKANAATKNVNILLLQDITIGGVQEFTNANNAEITVDGNGKTVTTTKGSGTNNNAFKITSAYNGKNITFKNMTVEHHQTQALFQVQATGLTLNVIEIEVKTDKDINYQYGLINLEKTSDLVLEKVNITLQAVNSNDKNSNAIIRTGNDSYPNVDNSKTVNITMNNCNLDATGATNRNGILIMNSTKAQISLNDSNIVVSNGAYVINRMVSDMTTGDIKNNTDVFVEGESELKAGTSTSLTTVIHNIDLSHIQAVRTVAIKVPVEFYDRFIEAIRSFAKSIGWKLDI